MESEEGEKENLSEVEKFQLIDFSSEDDFLVDHPFRDSPEDLRLSVTFRNISEHDSTESLNIENQLKVEKRENIQHQREEKLSDPGSLEARRASYLRKSIAWDNAFFSSAGVLDPEELSSMNEGFKRHEYFLFPGIQEDLNMCRSADSDLTFESFDSDAFSLESFDGDLFEDVRASICRSCGTYNLKTSSCDSVIGKAETLNVLSSKKVHVNSQNMRNFSANSRRKTTNYKKSKALTESSLSSQNLQHIKGVYDSTPKILGAHNAIATGQPKRTTLGYGNVKSRKTGEGLMVPKQSASVDSPSFMKFSTPPTKSSYIVSHTSTRSSSFAGFSCDEFSSTLSTKSLLSCGTRNIGSSSTKTASSGSTSKPPLRYSGRSRLNNQTSPMHLLSMSHHSNNLPASSIDGCSSESSSSPFSATAKRRSGNSEDKLRTDNDQASGSYQFSHRKMSPDQHRKGATREASPVLVEPRKYSKPSGLRMPSPKNGFFEGKSMVRSTIDTLQFRFRSQNVLSDPNTIAVKRRPSKIQPLRNVPGTRNKTDSPLTQALHCTSSPRPQRSMLSKKLHNFSTKSTGMRNSFGPGSKFRSDTSFEVDNAYCSKTRKVGKGEDDRKKVVLASSLKSEEKRNMGILKNKIGKEWKDQKAENGILLETTEPVKKDRVASRELLESKENFEDRVNGLSRYFEAIDIGGNSIDLKAKRAMLVNTNKSLDGEHFLCKHTD